MSVRRFLYPLVLLSVIGPTGFGSEKPPVPAFPVAEKKAAPKSRDKKGTVNSSRTSARNADAAPWPQFLGPDRNNCSREKGLLATWPDGGPKLLGTVTGLGIGFSNVSVADGVAYTMGNHGEREFVLAFDLDSGKNVWKFDNAAAYHNGYGDGPRSTPTIDGDKLYALGGSGDLVCLNRKTCNKVWQTSLVKEFGSGVPGWGFCESVLIDGDQLICTPGVANATLVALNKQTGKLLWKAAVPQNDRAAYASPIVVVAGDVRQYVQLTSSGTIGIRANDGKFLWRDDSAANGVANCSAPVAANGMVVSASGYGKGGSMVELTSNAGETACRFVWHTNDLTVHHGGLVLYDGHVYATNDQVLNCIELKTGKTKWKNRCVGKGSLTFADGRLIVRSEGGPVALVEATPAEYRELGRFDQPERSGKPAWPYPVVAGGKLLLRDQDKLLGYDLQGK
jgi:outer membrane protein assembly factor BamB